MSHRTGDLTGGIFLIWNFKKFIRDIKDAAFLIVGALGKHDLQY
jgi:hypothetical protein